MNSRLKQLSEKIHYLLQNCELSCVLKPCFYGAVLSVAIAILMTIAKHSISEFFHLTGGGS